MNVGRLHGKFLTGDTCSVARKVGRDFCTRRDEVAKEKNMHWLLMNGKIIKTYVELFQYHQRKVCIDAAR